MTTEEDGNSLDGVAPETFVPDLEARGADVVGLNCSVGPAAMLETLERMARVAHVKLAAQPNAGKPREIEGRNLYLSLAGLHGVVRAAVHQRRRAPRRRLLRDDAGPHPRDQERRAVAGAGRGAEGVPVTAPAAAAPPVEPPVPREQKSRMANTLARGGFVVSVELDAAARLPDRGAGRAGARSCSIRGVDLVNIPDSPRASARMSALSAALSWSNSSRASKRSSTTPAATGTCSGCSRTCSARTPWASATCCWSPAIRRRSATTRTRRRCSTSIRSAWRTWWRG